MMYNFKYIKNCNFIEHLFIKIIQLLPVYDDVQELVFYSLKLFEKYRSVWGGVGGAVCCHVGIIAER